MHPELRGSSANQGTNARKVISEVFAFLVLQCTAERTGFNMYAEYTQLKLTFLALVPWR